MGDRTRFVKKDKDMWGVFVKIPFFNFLFNRDSGDVMPSPNSLLQKKGVLNL